MLPLGTALPPFDLEVVPGTKIREIYSIKGLKSISPKNLSKESLLVMIICAHCPFVKHIEIGITNLDKDYGDKVQILAISSNSLITHPQDCSENLAIQANNQGWRFPYLLDLDQSLAKALTAACTPDFFLFSSSLTGDYKLKYRGQLDESRPGNEIPVNGKDLRLAIKKVLLGDQIDFDQKPSIGCNIKWHPGKEPDWFR